MQTPQAIIDSLNALEAAKDAADGAVKAKDTAATALVNAGAADVAAAKDLTDKTEALKVARNRMGAMLDAYYQPGAPAPTPAPGASAPTPPPTPTPPA